MGQYYTPLTQKGDDLTTRTSYTLKYKGEFNGYKLTEHSWWLNPFMNSFVTLLYRDPHRVAWVGDYSKDKEVSKENHFQEFIRDNRRCEVELTLEELTLDGLYLVNHSKKVYLNCSDYYNRCATDGWCLHPISLLTAVGNGEGGGDYYGENSSDVGAWAWDIISVEDEPPAAFKEVKYTFIEND